MGAVGDVSKNFIVVTAAYWEGEVETEVFNVFAQLRTAKDQIGAAQTQNNE